MPITQLTGPAPAGHHPKFGLCAVEHSPNSTVLAISMAIDHHTAPAFRGAIAEIAQSGQTRLVIDLTDLPFMDSTGLAVLVGGMKKMRARNGDLLLVSPDRDSPTMKILRITGLTKVFAIFPDLDQALAYQLPPSHWGSP